MRVGHQQNTIQSWVVILFVFVLYSANALILRNHYSSPDETANQAFAKQFAESGTLQIPLNGAPSIVHPRSFSVRGDALVPGSFVGLPLLQGAVGKAFGWGAAAVVSPLLTILALVALYVLLRDVFGRRIAQLSTVLIAVNPAVWFYAVRPYWHNGPFVAFLVIAAYAVHRWVRLGNAGFAALAGGSIGLALAMRGSEFLWVLTILVVTLLYVRRNISWHSVGAACTAMVLVLIPVLMFQGTTFGSAVPNSYAGSISGGSGESLLFRFALLVLAPFGWNIVVALRTFGAFGLGLLFPSIGLGIIGGALFLRGAVTVEARRWRRYASVFLLLTLWLVLYYGNFQFVEFRLDPDAILLSNSHVRYWLPLIVASIPLGVALLVRAFPGDGRRRWMLSFTVVTIVLISLVQMVWDPHDGIVVTRKNVINGASVRRTVVASTPNDAIIIAGINDKVLYPERRVVGFDYGTTPDAVVRAIPELVLSSPTYVVNPVPGEVSRLRKLLVLAGLGLDSVETKDSAVELYSITPRPTDVR